MSIKKKPGPKPIGSGAMTSTERQRRHRAELKRKGITILHVGVSVREVEKLERIMSAKGFKTKMDAISYLINKVSV